MEMNVPPLAESTASGPRSIFLRTPPVPDDIQHGFEAYKRKRNASAPFVARDDRWNDTEKRPKQHPFSLFFLFKRETRLIRLEKTFVKLKNKYFFRHFLKYNRIFFI